MDLDNIDEAKNLQDMLRGELYWSFTPQLIKARDRCRYACDRFNDAGEVSRRKLVELWREYVSTSAASQFV